MAIKRLLTNINPEEKPDIIIIALLFSESDNGRECQIYRISVELELVKFNL